MKFFNLKHMSVEVCLFSTETRCSAQKMHIALKFHSYFDSTGNIKSVFILKTTLFRCDTFWQGLIELETSTNFNRKNNFCVKEFCEKQKKLFFKQNHLN